MAAMTTTHTPTAAQLNACRFFDHAILTDDETYWLAEWEHENPYLVECHLDGEWDTFYEYIPGRGEAVPARFASAAEALDRIASEVSDPSAMSGDWTALRVTKYGVVIGSVSVAAVEATRRAIAEALS